MAYSSADPNAFLAMGIQSAFGTPQTTAAKLRFAKYLSGTDVQASMDVVDLREGGDGLVYGYSYKKTQKVTGQIVINARPEIAGQLMQALPGGATWNGASGPALHTFHSGHASFPWVTLFLQHPGSTLPQIVSDALFTGLTLEMMSGEPAKLTIPFIGITHGASFNPLTPTYFAEEPFLFHHAPTYVIDGSGDTRVTGIKVEYGIGIEELQTQAVTLQDIAVQNIDADVEITRQYVDSTVWKKINMGAGVAPTTSVATGSLRAKQQYGAAGVTMRSFETSLGLLTYRQDQLAELDPDGKTVYETISAKALKGASQAVVFYVENSHASAYAP